MSDVLFTTQRLIVRKIATSDANFILQLVNDPDWLTFIGDRHVHTNEDAVEFIIQGPCKSYQQHGFGLYIVAEGETGEPMGVCGLLKREYLVHPDIGYALLPRYRGQGFITETCVKLIDNYRLASPGHPLYAMIQPHNSASIRLIERLNFRLLEEKTIDGKITRLYRLTG